MLYSLVAFLAFFRWRSKPKEVGGGEDLRVAWASPAAGEGL